MIKWLEISADYECNNRCTGCFSVSSGGPTMSTREAVDTLRVGWSEGAEWLWMGGGEPTLRKDLFTIVAASRRLGYTRVKLQTNGMMLAYPQYVKRCLDAGVTEINFSIKGASAASHDRLTRTPGCFDLLVKGIAEWQKTGLPMEGDILVYRSNMAELPEMVRFYSALGVQRFNLWLLFSSDSKDADVAPEVPRISEAMPFITAAMDLKLSDRPDFITSLHTPACTVPGSHHAALFHPADLDLLVANPGGHRFRLEESPIEGGFYVDGCESCAARARCNGLRRDYVSLHGDAEFVPLSAK